MLKEGREGREKSTMILEAKSTWRSFYGSFGAVVQSPSQYIGF